MISTLRPSTAIKLISRRRAMARQIVSDLTPMDKAISSRDIRNRKRCAEYPRCAKRLDSPNMKIAKRSSAL